MESADRPRIIRFGVFEVDLRSDELFKGGHKVKIQEQPFQILAALLEHPGETVTREELQHKLWPQDTFVDFDHSLNTAVRLLRLALGDSTESPRYGRCRPTAERHCK
jgi:DNA-binding winged helix-turn-helix (wHTH) protein